MEIKRHWLGPNFTLAGPRGNVVAKTNVPDIRLRFREETLREELDLVWRHGPSPAPSVVAAQQRAQAPAPSAAAGPGASSPPAPVAGAEAAGDVASFPGVFQLAEGKKRRASAGGAAADVTPMTADAQVT